MPSSFDGADTARPRAWLSARQYQVLLWLLVPLTLVGVFVVPFWFPPRVATFSSAYLYGFNNRVAALIVMCLAAVHSIAGVYAEGPHLRPVCTSQKTSGALPWWALPAAVLVVVSFTAVLGRSVLQSESFSSDAAYFLIQLSKASLFHLKLYRDIEFAYGPLLFYAPLAVQHPLRPVGVGPEGAYLVTLGMFQTISMVLVFDVVQRLPGTPQTRGLALALMVAGSLQPSLGINYTLFRFLLAPWALLVLADEPDPKRRAFLVIFAQVLILATSPEMGIAFFAGLLVLTSVQAFSHHWVEALLQVGAALLGGALFFLSLALGRCKA